MQTLLIRNNVRDSSNNSSNASSLMDEHFMSALQMTDGLAGYTTHLIRHANYKWIYRYINKRFYSNYYKYIGCYMQIGPQIVVRPSCLSTCLLS
jgi:hypothetical protein